jgi:RNA polymerase sigma factor (TIGR02999 family)
MQGVDTQVAGSRVAGSRDAESQVGGSPVEVPQVLELLSEVEAGVAPQSEQLFVALYDELHRLAERQRRRGGSELTIGTTTLLHEAYLDIAGRDGARFPDRARFMGYAARAMRGLVIDYARRSRAKKRGGGVFQITLTGDITPAGAPSDDEASELDRLSDALDELAQLEPSLAELVDLHFFCGYSFAEIAEFRGVSERTVQRDWRKGRLLLHSTMVDRDEPGDQASR